MGGVIYVETSAVLRATIESGTSPRIESDLRRADRLVTSRLSLVEVARALHRVRRERRLPEPRLAQLERDINALWQRSTIWEITREVCDLAAQVTPHLALRSLDAIHVATFLLAVRKTEDLQMLSTDVHVRAALGLPDQP